MGKLVELEANFGVKYSPEKWVFLVKEFKDSGWSLERFERTFKWFIKNKKFPAWTISDWFDYEIKVYNYQWYLYQQHLAGIYTNVLEQMYVYKLPTGHIVYKWADGEELPFERVDFTNKK